MLYGTLFLLFIFACEIAAQRSWIICMRQKHVSQVQKSYVECNDSETKSKIPTMGGVVFMLIGSGLLISETVSGDVEGMAFWSFPLMSAAVGLCDDLLKYTHKSSEGLRSMQKFALQTAVTLVWFVLLVSCGSVPQLFPGVGVGHLVWPFAFFLAVGVQNSVNVTDGLDGLAAGACAISFAALACMGCTAQRGAIVGLALSGAFLWHNCHPAKVFMGDAGAHFLAGLMTSCAFSRGVLLLIPSSFIFGIEMISVVIQLIAIHKFGRKVFRMSPIHHHFQLLGWPETAIVVRFWVAHAVGCALLAALSVTLERMIA